MVIKLHHALLGFFVFALLTSFIRNSSTLANNLPFYNQLQSEFEREKAKNEELKLGAAKANNPYELEKLLRNKLGLVKAKEQIVVIPNLILSPTITPTPSSTQGSRYPSE